MQRSVIQLAGKTLVVSLPAAWCRENGVKKGAKVEVDESTGHLTIMPRGAKEAERISIDITGMPSKIAWHHVRTAYATGFREIEIITSARDIVDQELNKKTSIRAFLQRFTQRFNGMELAQQTRSTYVLTDMTTPNAEEFQRAYSRILQLVRAMNTPPEKIDEATRMDDLLLYEDQLNRLVDFCERVLHASRGISTRAMIAYVKILHGLETLGDETKKLASDEEWASIDSLAGLVDKTITALQSMDEQHVLEAFAARAKLAKNDKNKQARNIVADILNAQYSLINTQHERAK